MLRIENVRDNLSPELKAELVAVWTNNQLLPAGADGHERAKQVILVVRNETNEIVGISTAYKKCLPYLNHNYFYCFRCMILPKYRCPGLSAKLTVQTRDHLESISASETEKPCIGMIVEVENKALREVKRDAIWKESQLVYIGNSPNGDHRRVYYFAGAKI